MTATPTEHPAVENCLFHYTSSGGLRGILENRCIWATDSAFLNDSSEVLYAGRAVELHLQNWMTELNLSHPPAGSLDRNLLSVLGSATDALVKFNNADDYSASTPFVQDGATYVSCFTEDPNQLSQWRAYGGRGYSIGFTRDSLDKLEIEGEVDRLKSVGPIKRVGYGSTALTGLYSEVSNYFNSKQTVGHPGSSGFFATANFVFPRLAAVKHEAFREEREWRAIISRYGHEPARKLHFRDGTRLVPYLKLKFDPSAVAWLWIGPGGNFHDGRALRAFLRESGYDLDRVWIEQSSAPYRDA